MKELAKQGVIAQAQLDEQLAEEANWKPPTMLAEEYYQQASDEYRNNYITRINRLELPGQREFLTKLHKNCSSDCNFK